MMPSTTKQSIPGQMPAGQNTGLASMFRSNAPTAPGTGTPSILPTIQQPQRPVLPPPPSAMPPQTPMAPTAGVNPYMIDGRRIANKQQALAAMINFPSKVTPQIEAMARGRGAQANNTWRR